MERWFGGSNRNISGRCVRMSLNIWRNGQQISNPACVSSCFSFHSVWLFPVRCQNAWRQRIKIKMEVQVTSTEIREGKSKEGETWDPCVSMYVLSIFPSCTVKDEDGRRMFPFLLHLPTIDNVVQTIKWGGHMKKGWGREENETSYQRGTREQEAKWYHVDNSCPTCERKVFTIQNKHENIQYHTHIHKRQD